MPNTEDIRRDGGRRVGGRLIALSQDGDVLNSNAFGNDMAIDFPSMPDVIELMRETDYNVQSSPMLPDGIHVYRGTKPLEIPFSFQLHAFDDDYCPQGAMTLLKIAARLHAFTLPISSNPNEALIISPVFGTSKSDDPVKDADGNATTAVGKGPDNVIKYNSATGSIESQVQGQGSLAPPLTAWLHLMWTGEESPGISCLGYVKTVSAKLMGPYLRGPNGSFNLPSKAEYSFTFVHKPGYSNAMFVSNTSTFVNNLGDHQSATAYDVNEKLYTTYKLVKSLRGFVGLNGKDPNAAANLNKGAALTPFSLEALSPGQPQAPEPLYDIFTSAGKTLFKPKRYDSILWR